MTRQAEWILSADWAVSRDPYNWVLMRRKGKGWTPVSYFANPQQLLESLHRKVLRTEPHQSNLVKHLEHCLQVAIAGTERLSRHIRTHLGPAAEQSLQTVASQDHRGVGAA